jgi:hypothetical protein
MNTSRGKNEAYSKKIGQFDLVTFKQCGERLFDNLFDFDRKLKEIMAYANNQKNGSLHERMQMDTVEMETALPLDSAPTDEIIDHQATNIEKLSNDLSEQIYN